MSPDQIAFFIGLFGSVHCVGMCGPLAFAVPSTQPGFWRMLVDKLTYNAGRVITYSALGLLIGLVGRQLWMAGLQQVISILSGGLIIAAGSSRLLKIKLAQGRFIKPFGWVNKQLIYALNHHAGHLYIGMLNGLLPCGFVYLALAGALNTSSPSLAAQYMFWFGIGTFPLMLAATLSAGFINPIVRKRINAIIPYFMICLGLWFILRGLALDIPYLSPAGQSQQTGVCH
ncbi:MAG TPA: sulfite exporter TauE/SafE family protein [Mucilaginibacter sp.]|nr:sulfite exporter TauE/SafE family protein [Mucilaginibacter sp.]